MRQESPTQASQHSDELTPDFDNKIRLGVSPTRTRPGGFFVFVRMVMCVKKMFELLSFAIDYYRIILRYLLIHDCSGIE